MITASKANRLACRALEKQSQDHITKLLKQIQERVDGAIAEGRFIITIPITVSEDAGKAIAIYTEKARNHGYYVELNRSDAHWEYRLTIGWA